MSSLNDSVVKVFEELTEQAQPFTIFDVTLKVREQGMFARHQQVRDIVRAMPLPSDYMTSYIEVTLKDGSKTNAILYHTIQDSLYLDVVYPENRRDQSTSSVASNTTSTTTSNLATSSTIPAPPAAPLAVANSQLTGVRQVWDNLFATNSSLFPGT